MLIMIRKNIRAIASAAITVAFVAYIYINRHSIFGAFADIQTVYLIPVIIGQLGIQLSNAALLKTTTKPLKVHLSFFESFKLTMISSFVNFFTPVVGGASTRAVYLKREHDLAYSSFLGVIYSNYLIIFVVSFFTGLMALVSISGALSVSAGKIVAIFFAAGTVFSLLFMLFGHLITNRLNQSDVKKPLIRKVSKKIALVDQGWSLIRRDRITMLSMTACSIATTASVTILYWGAMKSLGINTGLNIALLYSALAIVGLLINITPGSLGIREAVYASIYTVTAIGAQQVVAFSLIDRMTQLILLGIGWILFNRAILKGFSKKDF